MMLVKTSKKITLISDNKIRLDIDSYYNIISIDGIEFEMKYLKGTPGNRGGNSNVFIIQPTSVEESDDYEPEQYIIKISKFASNGPYSKFIDNRRHRFRREILALKRANQSKLTNVVKLINYGEIAIEDKLFPFYTMEKANSDLNDYLIEKKTIQQKIFLFQSILEGIKQLHNIKIYHRDIKHDNIFMFGEECKVGDLGLIRYKDEDDLALDKDQRIGAFGWETPEAMNKLLTEDKNKPEFTFDCIIDEASDIFQLGKLFWYILQGNLPIGCICFEDFKINDKDLFEILSKLLQHGKDNGNGRRPINISIVETLIAPIAKRYAVT